MKNISKIVVYDPQNAEYKPANPTLLDWIMACVFSWFMIYLLNQLFQ